MPTKGRTLRVQRVRVGITQTALAARMGLHRNTIMGWEKQAEVPTDYAQAYLAALEKYAAEKRDDVA